MGGTKARPYGSTTKARTWVLAALGVVKVATAEQIRQLTCPGTADAQTVRNAAKDLGVEGLVVSLGSATRINDKGNRVSEKLWNLTPAGLEAAGVVLDREVKEMGGTAKASVPSGAPHARKVTDTITAFLQPVPEPTRPVVRKNQPPPTVPAQATAGPSRPAGIGTLSSWETEVVLPVAGTFTTPVKGSPRADAVLTAPGAGLPVLFVEVDNGTEDRQIVANKIFKYRRFFRRTVKDRGARDVPMWHTLYGHAGHKDGHPPVAIVFTAQVGPEAMMNRMKAVRDLSAECWQGHWRGGSLYGAGVKDGYRDYDDTVPVIVTTLPRLQQHGPHGPIWWRYGHSTWETLEAALDNPDDYRAFSVREEERRLERRAQEEREQREREETTRRQKAAAWACPACGRDVYSSDDWQSVPAGSDCSVCTRAKERERQAAEQRAAEEAQAKAEAEAWRRENGLFGFLRR
ncbi:replication-relaxation family protein [Streptomyces agglomeratus]|uniref:replication-relaxation family protein n=1 Tax=Streptomyces agglomeratus TaxID=285458 RepID=UPI00159F34CC|nr:replication-relaxation family protein [Streptomyces agglomeratus]